MNFAVTEEQRQLGGSLQRLGAAEPDRMTLGRNLPNSG